MAFSSSSSISSSIPSEEAALGYDVFLSFRGDDTRCGFTSYLHYALEQKGYTVFFDDENLERGNVISKGLIEGIENSRSSIVVLSENFADSRWCLTELAKIVECMESPRGLIVLPIFYHVDPSLVRNQGGIYGDAFKKHENNPKLNSKEVENWRDALRKVGNLAGWTLHKSDIEAKFMENFTARTSKILLESTKLNAMGRNVFGRPITDSTLRAMPEYVGKEAITATDRAHVALEMIDADNKLADAKTFVHELNSTHGNGTSTQCLIYNATGGTLEFLSSISWCGRIVEPPSYPRTIENGQWGAFLHVKDPGISSGSVAAAVYGGKNADGVECDCMLSWWNSWGENKVYTEIRRHDYYRRGHILTIVYNQLKQQGVNSSDIWKGCVSSVNTSRGTSPMFEGVLKLMDA